MRFDIRSVVIYIAFFLDLISGEPKTRSPEPWKPAAVREEEDDKRAE